MTLTPLRNEYFVVSVPEGANGFCFYQASNDLCYYVGTPSFQSMKYKALPIGDYTIVGLAKDLTEEQAGEMVELDEDGSFTNYMDESSEFNNPLHSFRSLLASLGIDPQTSLIIKLNK